MTDHAFGLFDVSVSFGPIRALDSVDVTVAPGTVTALIGGDGAGKTTAVRSLVGLIEVGSGRVRRPHRAAIGYQPEGAGTWADLTVTENLDFVARAHGHHDHERRRRLLEVTGLDAAQTRLAGNLSGGMRQKLAVAMAMLAEPELVVLDEPTTGLDPVSRAELWRLLLRSAGEGAALLVTTSYLDEAERADHVTVLDEGMVVAAGSAAEIRAGFPGVVAVGSTPPESGRAWRRGRSWRVWAADGAAPEGTVATTPDLEDVVTAAALARRERLK